jgi:hypothetical protein
MSIRSGEERCKPNDVNGQTALELMRVILGVL